MCRGRARVCFRLSTEIRGLKPGTIAHHQLFHCCCFFARTGKSPKLQVAEANFQEGKAQKGWFVSIKGFHSLTLNENTKLL